jgi:hypothetical protein
MSSKKIIKLLDLYNFLAGKYVSADNTKKIFAYFLNNTREYYDSRMMNFFINCFYQFRRRFNKGHFLQMTFDYRKINPQAFRFINEMPISALEKIITVSHHIRFFRLCNRYDIYMDLTKPHGKMWEIDHMLRFYLPIHKICMIQLYFKCGTIVMSKILSHMDMFVGMKEVQILALCHKALNVIEKDDKYVSLYRN